jgi:hypothetical protein
MLRDRAIRSCLCRKQNIVNTPRHLSVYQCLIASIQCPYLLTVAGVLSSPVEACRISRIPIAHCACHTTDVCICARARFRPSHACIEYSVEQVQRRMAGKKNKSKKKSLPSAHRAKPLGARSHGFQVLSARVLSPCPLFCRCHQCALTRRGVGFRFPPWGQASQAFRGFCVARQCTK